MCIAHAAEDSLPGAVFWVPLVRRGRRGPCNRNGICRPGFICVADSCVVAQDATSVDSGPTDALPNPLDAEMSDSGSAGDLGVSSCPSVQIEGGGTFCTIGAAIASATAGSTILVPAGTFDEHILLDRPLTIRGRGSAGATVSEVSVTGGEPAIQVSDTGSGSIVSFVAVRASGTRAFQIAGSAHLTAVRVLASVGAGVAIVGRAVVTMSASDVLLVSAVQGGTSADGAGILLAPGTELILRDGLISLCDGAGIHATQARVTVYGTDVSQNGTGLIASDQSTVQLRSRARFDRNRSGGIVVSGGTLDAQTISANGNGTANASEGDGIRLPDSGLFSVEGCTLQGNRGWGMFCGPGINLNRCSDNVFSGNGAGVTNCVPCQ